MARSTFLRLLPRVGLALLLYLPVQSHAGLRPSLPCLEVREFPAILIAKTPGVASKERRSREDQYKAFSEQLRVRYEEWLSGRGTMDLMFEAVRFMEASGLTLLQEAPTEEVAFREKVLDLVKRIEQRAQQRYQEGRIGPQDLEAAHDLTLNTEIELLKAKRRAKSSSLNKLQP
jgi:hypothetical protein